MIRIIAVWLVLVIVGETLYWHSEHRYVRQPGVYLSTDYRGIHFSDMIYGAKPGYAWLHTLALHAGAIALLPALILASRQQRPRDVDGNIVTHRDWRMILRNYQRCVGRKRWQLPTRGRNDIWLGVDLLTMQPVLLRGEAIFQGLMIIGQQGIGKTSRFFKAILTQLAEDQKTSFVNFTLKQRDGQDIWRFLEGHGIAVLPWSMGNLVHLAIDRHGAYGHSRLEALLQAAGWASGLGSEREPFWCDTSMTHIARILLEQIAKGEDPTLGSAFEIFETWVAKHSRDDRMYQGLLETLRAALSSMGNPADRVCILYAQRDGGLHRGLLHARAGAELRELTEHGAIRHRLEQAMMLPQGLYLLEPGTRRPLAWKVLLQPYSLMLPPAGGSKADKFALNFIKSSLFAWISDDMASEMPRLLVRDPRKRHRIVLAMDECHNFIGHHGVYSDAKALAEYRESGLVYLGATQSLTRLRQGEQAKHLLSVIGTYIFLRVSGREPSHILDLLGQIGVRRIRRQYGLSEADQAKGKRNRANVSESVETRSERFIAEDLYRQFRPGMAIAALPGEPMRVIYCPYHDQLETGS